MAQPFELVLKLLVPAPDPVGLLFAAGGFLVLIELNLGRQEEVHHGRDEGAGEEVAGEHGEGDGHRQAA